MAGKYKLKPVQAGKSTAKYRLTPTVKVDPKHVSFAELQRLKAQVDRGQIKVETLGGKVKHHGPSLLSRAFDIVSRPAYATANFTLQGLRHRNQAGRGPGDVRGSDFTAALKGFVGGLSGKNKTSFSDVLKEGGVKNRAVRAVGGLAGDVLLDPSTYVGVGIVKGGTKAAGVEGARAAATVARAEKAASEIDKVKTLASVRTALRANKVSASDVRGLRRAVDVAAKTEEARIGKPLSKKALETLRKNVVTARKEDALQKAQHIVGANNRGRIVLRVHGQEVASSEALHRVLGAPGRKLSEKDSVHSFLSLFRTQTQFPGDINRIKQTVGNVNAAEFEGRLRALKSAFTNTSKADRKAISHAIEADTVDQLPAHLQDAARYAKGELEDIYRTEAQRGLVGEYKGNYVYHVYNNQRAISRSGLGNGKKFETLLDAKRAGVAPIEDIADIVAHRLGKHYTELSKDNFLKEIADNFGLNKAVLGKGARKSEFENLVKQGDLIQGRGDSRLSSYFFDKDVKEAMDNYLEKAGRTSSTKFFLKQYDRVLRNWKKAVTAPNPGFHARNLMGDMWNNFLDGVIDGRHYANALKTVTGHGDFTLKVGDKTLGRQEVKTLYERLGLKSGFYRGEVGVIASPHARALSAADDAIRAFSEGREDMARLAHFMDALKKEARGKKFKSFEDLVSSDAARNAAQRVRKFNFDYMDLTDFEKTKLKRVVPFYTWMRKNIPLQLEMMAMRPGRVAVAPKGMRAIEELLGTRGQEPLPGLEDLTPKWLRDQVPILLRQGSADGSTNPLFAAPRLPYSDIGQYGEGLQEGSIRGSLNAFLNSVTPAVKIPLEIGTGRSLYTGAEIPNTKDYLVEQIPMAGRFFTDQGKEALKRAAPIATLHLPNGKTVKLSERMLNTLAGFSLKESTIQMQKGELRRRQDPIQRELHKLLAEYRSGKRKLPARR